MTGRERAGLALLVGAPVAHIGLAFGVSHVLVRVADVSVPAAVVALLVTAAVSGVGVVAGLWKGLDWFAG